MAKRLLIAEDHALVRQGLMTILSAIPAYEVVGEAENGLRAVKACDEFHPDLVLMDLSMPKMNGVEAIREIKSRHPEIRILAVTVHKTEDQVLQAFDAGADGYVLKDSTKDELLLAINSVLNGTRFISPMISEKVIEGYLEGSKNLKKETSWDSLTSRERQVLKLIGEGHTNREVADLLCISPKTVETHRSNIMKKLDVHNAAELTAHALKMGLISL